MNPGQGQDLVDHTADLGLEVGQVQLQGQFQDQGQGQYHQFLQNVQHTLMIQKKDGGKQGHWMRSTLVKQQREQDRMLL